MGLFKPHFLFASIACSYAVLISLGVSCKKINHSYTEPDCFQWFISVSLMFAVSGKLNPSQIAANKAEKPGKKAGNILIPLSPRTESTVAVVPLAKRYMNASATCFARNRTS